MRILFLGEGDVRGPARYLSAILTWAKLPFDHECDQRPVPPAFLRRRYDAIVLSDYRHANFTRRTEQWLVDRVQGGSGLLMIGGWASFTGLVGGYAATAIEELLPVRCVPGDDRVNWASGVAVTSPPGPLSLEYGEGGKKSMPFTPSPRLEERGKGGEVAEAVPVVCGYHRVVPKSSSHILLDLRDLHFKRGQPTLGKPHPGLVVGSAGLGRTAAFMTDCAPHWAGGLVDWGRRRVRVPVRGGGTVEVGDRYLDFFARLIRWTAKA